PFDISCRRIELAPQHATQLAPQLAPENAVEFFKYRAAAAAEMSVAVGVIRRGTRCVLASNEPWHSSWLEAIKRRQDRMAGLLCLSCFCFSVLHPSFSRRRRHAPPRRSTKLALPAGDGSQRRQQRWYTCCASTNLTTDFQHGLFHLSELVLKAN